MTAAPVAAGSRRNRRLGFATVAAGVLLLAPDSLSIRLMSMDPWMVVLCRGLATAVGYSALIALGASSGGRRRAPLTGNVLAIACLAAVGNICFVLAIRHTATAHALVIIASSPVFSAIITRVFLGEAVARRTWLASVVVLAGVGATLLARPPTGVLVGDVAAVGGAISLAALFVAIRRASGVELLPPLAAGGLVTTAVATPFALPPALAAADVGLVLAYTTTLLPVGLWLVMRGPRYLSPPEVSLLMLGETVLGTLCVWAVIGERPPLQTVLAGFVILTTLAVHSVVTLRAADTAARG